MQDIMKSVTLLCQVCYGISMSDKEKYKSRRTCANIFFVVKKKKEEKKSGD